MHPLSNAILTHAVAVIRTARVPRPLYNALMGALKGIDLSEVETVQVDSMLRWAEDLQVHQHEVKAFEFIKSRSQRGAAYFYRNALQAVVDACKDEFRAREQRALEFAYEQDSYSLECELGCVEWHLAGCPNAVVTR